MVLFKIKDIDYKIPTSWKDVTCETYCKIITFDGTNQEFIELLSGIPCATIKELNEEIIISILELLKFVNDLELLKLSGISSDFKFDVGSESWDKLEKAKQAIKKQTNYFCSCVDLVKIYFDRDISQESITKVYAEVVFILNNINEFFEKYKRLNDYEEDEDEFVAGVSRFERFGFFASCVELSRKMGKTYNEVLAMPANEVYQTFLYDFEKADYEKALLRIKSNKK